MYILTIVNENESLTRIVIGCAAAAAETGAILTNLGYEYEPGMGDAPERCQQEMRRVWAVMEEVHNFLLAS